MSDRTFHDAFKQEAYYLPTTPEVRCRNCGTWLKTYYAEARLYAVKCGYCETITLVKASNPTEAARYAGEYAGNKADERCKLFKPAADVVEVVRCKDCKHGQFMASCDRYLCHKVGGSMRNADDFCNYGG